MSCRHAKQSANCSRLTGALDSRDFKTFGELYAQDGEYVGGGSMGVSKGPAAIAAALENVITTNASGANLHVYSNEKITITGTDSAAATSRGAFYVQNETGGPIPLMFATYKDEFVREGGVWKFKRREVIGDIPGP
ncbi:MAG: nuclear transport factor 2 family protein [Pseudomonadota bacterium]